MNNNLSEYRLKYVEAAKELSEIRRALRKKHSSKVYKGFCKMCLRQDSKPTHVTINLPEYNKLPKNFRGEYVHCFIVHNNRWNGMNLKTLCKQYFHRVGYFKSAIQVNPLTGKYSLTLEGKRKLKRMRERKLENITNEL